MKKTRRAKGFKNWEGRIFKLQRDTLTLDYFDVKVYDKISCHGTYSTPTVMSAHREAVDNDINPIWFQKKCKYTFQCYEHSDTSHLFNNGSELKNHDGGNVSSGVDDDKKTVLAEYGTEYEEHRSTWVKALMKFNDVDVA